MQRDTDLGSQRSCHGEQFGDQLAALQSKIEQLEKAQTGTRKTADEAQATADKTADVVAQERSRMSFAGDVRYRNESFDVEYVDRDRQRDRIRARLHASFRVNDTLSGQIGLATGADDPRSSNQTMDGQNSRKQFGLDVAYLTWAPNASWRATAGGWNGAPPSCWSSATHNATAYIKT